MLLVVIGGDDGAYLESPPLLLSYGVSGNTADFGSAIIGSSPIKRTIRFINNNKDKAFVLTAECLAVNDLSFIVAPTD